MGYMYDKLKIALGGSKFSSSHTGVVKDWTPNGIKALFITRSCIIVINHIKQTKIINMNIQESEQDISRNGVSGALHNLLLQRQLSCLEEIYVDSVFQNYQGIMNIDEYVAKSMKTTSRLRYYGYINLVDAGNVISLYDAAKYSNNLLYAYATDKGRTNVIQYKSTNNSNWYKNYNLRPQYYALDADGGMLARWFRKCEDQLLYKVDEQEKILYKTTLNTNIYAMFDIDVLRMYDVRTLMRIYKYSGRYKDDEILSTVHRVIGRKMKEDFTIKGLRVADLKEAVMFKSGKLNDSGKYILSAYKNLGVFDLKANNPVKLEDIQEYVDKRDGFLQLTSVLEGICCDLYTSNKKVKMMLKLSSTMHKDEIPLGEFRRLVGLGDSGANVDYKGFLTLLLSVCGCTLESFNRVYLSEWEV